ncbi:MAG: transcription antitermination factor NusB [Bacteroidota bacterium]
MISRRQLRIKVLQTLYAYYNTDGSEISKSEKELHFSINKAYELYHYLLILIVDVILYAESRIEIARNKKIPTYEDIHPNTRFVDNRIITLIRENADLLRYVGQHKLNWANYPELIREIYGEIIADEAYAAYMAAAESDFDEDKKILIRIYNQIILPNENLDQVLEEQSIFWNDDLEYIVSMVVKTIKRFRENDSADKELLPMYKNEEDKDFAIQLFRNALMHREEYLGYIRDNTRNWDLERIAFLDILIMQMAIAEMITFSSIPTKVTLNEYLDIAKFYSTEKSNVFINGVLDKIMAQLKAEKKLVKKGRGLIGEVEPETEE